MFFADYSRDCIWVVFPGGNGLPDPATVAGFVTPAINPVDIQISPDGELFYVDFDFGTIRRIRYFDGNQPPTAVAGASATYGPAPLTVDFDATGSSDPDAGDTLSYAWDLDGDGAYDDSTSASPSRTYPSGNVTVGLRVTDSKGLSHTDSVVISAGNTPPVATIGAPAASLTWKVGDVVAFSGSATDEQEGGLAASRLSWSLIMRHCPSNCHSHVLQTFSGVSSGSFIAPDHEYPSHLELRLTATDANGLIDTKSVLLQPQTVDLTFQSAPPGLRLVVGPAEQAAPFTRTVIVGSSLSVTRDVAPDPERYDLCVLGVVRRRCADAQRDRTGNRVVVHRDLCPDLAPVPWNGPGVIGCRSAARPHRVGARFACRPTAGQRGTRSPSGPCP